jgi:hypothetical protein
MTILGIIAIVAVVVLGLIVLRVKSDPMEKESVRKILADAKPVAANDATDARPPEKPDQPS